MLADLWETMAVDAAAESSLWADCLLPEPERDRSPVFSPLGEARYALGLETIYEGYLVHYGRSRLFAPPDDDTALLLGDYLYAHGVARISALHDVAAVADLVGADLPLQPGARGGDATATARSGPRRRRCSAAARSTSRGRRSGSTPTRSRSRRPARAAVGDEAVDAALAAHAARRG